MQRMGAAAAVLQPLILRAPSAAILFDRYNVLSIVAGPFYEFSLPQFRRQEINFHGQS